MPSKVYFLDDKAAGPADSSPFKAVQVLRDAGLKDMIKPGCKVAIKTHFGEWGATMNLRPHNVSAIVDEVKRLGGLPEVVETCTAPYLEVPTRARASDHLRVAAAHGFTEETMGCPIRILDGEYGIEDVRVDVPKGVYLKYVHMAQGLLDYDVVIVVSHFKGHGMGVFGGALKNVGIGLVSGRGKLGVHYITHPELGIKNWALNPDGVKRLQEMPRPNVLDRMIAGCPHDVFSYDENGEFKADKSKCKVCGFCMGTMFAGAFVMTDIMKTWAASISDSASAIINKIGAENMIYVNYALDIGAACDCMNFHDRVMVPNVGMFASKDPVALDMACVEAAEAQLAIPGSVAEVYGFAEPNTERFTNCSSMAKVSQWTQINTAVYNGTGNSEYVLVNSETKMSDDFLLPPYSAGRNYFMVNKDAYRNITMDIGDFAYDHDNPVLSLEEQAVKPKGKVGEISIKEE
ncbi:MAG: DUF362 domain-containing protein [Eubacteriaceae bacterium]|nr:DUF362 domain-containing protein [Eubacteriaceae bacterium]